MQLCTACNLSKSQVNKGPLKPIISPGFMTRLQVHNYNSHRYLAISLVRNYAIGTFQMDLIDMRHLPDGEMNWILHLIDHWSKFNLAYPIHRKSAASVANALKTHVLPIFGVPRILQCDNGREFVNKTIQSLLEDWPGSAQIVHGRPRHPQSQGLVEQAHHTLERMMASKIEGHKKTSVSSPPWASWLPHIVCKCTNCSDLSHKKFYNTSSYYRCLEYQNPPFYKADAVRGSLWSATTNNCSSRQLKKHLQRRRGR